jgi:hypothetical protein
MRKSPLTKTPSWYRSAEIRPHRPRGSACAMPTRARAARAKAVSPYQRPRQERARLRRKARPSMHSWRVGPRPSLAKGSLPAGARERGAKEFVCPGPPPRAPRTDVLEDCGGGINRRSAWCPAPRCAGGCETSKFVRKPVRHEEAPAGVMRGLLQGFRCGGCVTITGLKRMASRPARENRGSPDASAALAQLLCW